MPTTKPLDRVEIDMSADAIEQRLRDVAQLYRFGMVIEDARRAWLADSRRPIQSDGEIRRPKT
jgi:hypothetical protein